MIVQVNRPDSAATYVFINATEANPLDRGENSFEDEGHGGRERENRLGRTGRSSVESRPSDPEETCAENGEGNVRCTLRFSLIFQAFAENQRSDVTRNAGENVHDRATGEVEGAQFLQPAIFAPHPMGHRIVTNGRPDEDEDHVWNQFHSSDDGSCNDEQFDETKKKTKGKTRTDLRSGRE